LKAEKISIIIDATTKVRRTRKEKGQEKALTGKERPGATQSDIIEIRDSSSKADDIRALSGTKRSSRISTDFKTESERPETKKRLRK